MLKGKVRRPHYALGRPVPTVQESALTMELANGSRVISLSREEGTIRGYSGVSLLEADEASRVSDALYSAIRPMLAVSQGRLVCLPRRSSSEAGSSMNGMAPGTGNG